MSGIIKPTNCTKSPDPAALVTHAVEKSEDHQNEKNEIRFKTLSESVIRIENQIESGPAAIKAEVESLHRLIISEMKRLEEIFTGRFTDIGNRFVDRDARAHILASAAKEAISKSELNIKEKMDSLQSIFDRTNQAKDTQLQGLKERLDRSEGSQRGIGDVIGWIVGGIGLIATVIAIATGITSFMN